MTKSANKQLRQSLAELMRQQNGKAFYPQPQYCTDNGAMIAYAGFLRLKNGEHSSLEIDVKPRWNMTELTAIISKDRNN